MVIVKDKQNARFTNLCAFKCIKKNSSWSLSLFEWETSSKTMLLQREPILTVPLTLASQYFIVKGFSTTLSFFSTKIWGFEEFLDRNNLLKQTCWTEIKTWAINLKLERNLTQCFCVIFRCAYYHYRWCGYCDRCIQERPILVCTVLWYLLMRYMGLAACVS